MRSLIIALISLTLLSCKQTPPMTTHYAFRLKPGQDLKAGIDSMVKLHAIKAGWIVTCVGSLTDYHIRFANVENGAKDTGHFEIVSLVGTLSVNGSHIHISICDNTGKTIGGHLLDGCKIYTTAEIIIAASSEMEFKRKEDGTTPWKELSIVKSEELKVND